MIGPNEHENTNSTKSGASPIVLLLPHSVNTSEIVNHEDGICVQSPPSLGLYSDFDTYGKGNRHFRDLNDDGTPSLSMFGA